VAVKHTAIGQGDAGRWFCWAFGRGGHCGDSLQANLPEPKGQPGWGQGFVVKGIFININKLWKSAVVASRRASR
jgi:hypothetical protein